MPRMPGRYRRFISGGRVVDRHGEGATRWRKRVEGRQAEAEITEALMDRYAAELADPFILDEYDAVVPGARDRILRMRHRAGTWHGVLPECYLQDKGR